MVNELSQIVGAHCENAIDSTSIKVHRCTTKVHAVKDRKGHLLNFS